MERSLKESKWDKIYINIAETIASASVCKRLKVGAILVKDNRIISYGYNGTPHGFLNECENKGKTKNIVLHAESNAIAKCAASTESSYGSSMYITTSPCHDCAKLIIQSKIEKVFYKHKYRDNLGLELLEKSNIKIYEI